MTYIIFNIIVVLFAIIGFVECMKILIFRIFKPKQDDTIMLISPIGKHYEDAEFILRSCGEKTRWMGRVRPKKVLCLDIGMDENTRLVCEAICREYKFMELVNIRELETILTSQSNNYSNMEL